MYEVQLVVQECMHAVANYVQSRWTPIARELAIELLARFFF